MGPDRSISPSIFGDIGDGRGVPVRLHRESVVDDVFATPSVLDRVVKRSRPAAAASSSICARAPSASSPTPQRAARARSATITPPRHSRERDWREIGLGAQILRDLGVTSIRLIASRERHYVGLDGFGIAIEATESLDG